MTFTLTFHKLHAYDNSDNGITIPIKLSANGRDFEMLAKLDTGSSYCIFEREVGEALGLDIENGELQNIGTATGSFRCYGHEVAIYLLGLETLATVYFASHPNLGRNVLGRLGFLQQFRMGIVDYDGKLYLSDYNQQ